MNNKKILLQALLDSISLEVQLSLNQNGLFTPKHARYEVAITRAVPDTKGHVTVVTETFHYQCNPEILCKENNKLRIVRNRMSIVYSPQEMRQKFKEMATELVARKRDDILMCLFSDVSCYEDYALEEFLVEFEYNDSGKHMREGMAVYKQCGREKEQLMRLFPNRDDYEMAMGYFSDPEGYMEEIKGECDYEIA